MRSGPCAGTAPSPDVRPDPCDAGDYVTANLALDRPVTASQEESEEYGARWVNDGSIRTWWSAADGAPQWVDIDLESDQVVGRIDVKIGDVTPRDAQTHRVYVRAADEAATGRLVGEMSGDVRDRDILSLDVDAAFDPVRYVRVETVDIDGWVIVHDIAVYGP